MREEEVEVKMKMNKLPAFRGTRAGVAGVTKS